MTPDRFAKLKQALDRRQPDLTVLMEHVDKPHNLAAIVRTADAVGLFEVHAVRPAAGGKVSRAVSSGSRRWVRMRTHPTLAAAVERLRAAGLQLYAADLAEQAVDYREVDYTRPTAVVLGTELYGVSAAARALVDGAIRVPMEGMTESLNVSVATALILYEARRQREAAGMYRQRRLDERTYRETLFEWAWPDVARICRLRAIPFPDLDGEGNLLGPARSAARPGAQQALE